jgi:uncharacterized protein (DUF58 family)
MTRKLLYALVAAVVAAVLASSATATTAPNVTVKIQVQVTDSAVKMSTYRARRGWGADFVVRNVGRKPHKLVIGGLPTRLLRPGARAIVRTILEERGRFPYAVTVNPGGPKHKGWFIVY